MFWIKRLRNITITHERISLHDLTVAVSTWAGGWGG